MPNTRLAPAGRRSGQCMCHLKWQLGLTIRHTSSWCWYREIHVLLQGYLGSAFDGKRVGKQLVLRVWYWREGRVIWTPLRRLYPPWLTPWPRILMFSWATWMRGGGDRNIPTQRSQWKEWKEDSYQNPGSIRRVLIRDNATPNLEHCEPLFLAGIIILTMNPFSPQMVRASVIGRYMRPAGSISGGNMNPITWQMDWNSVKVLKRSMTVT